jgi:hypothetical protein
VLIEAGVVRTLGSGTPRLAFGEEPKVPGAWAGRRLLLLDGRPAYELSFWCGTCQFLFRRLDGSNDTLSVEDLRDRLTVGLSGLDDDVVTAFGGLLGSGSYLPLLLTVHPRLLQPSGPGDYFAEEQVATWGVDAFWGLPEYPATAYYRTFETAVGADAHLYEFLVPMLPPAWDDRTTLDQHARRLAGSAAPTAVAVSTLDVCAPAMDHGSDYYQHWGLTHFVLDGHHKIHAAAATGRPLRLLSLLSMDASLATPEQLQRVPALRAEPQTSRQHKNNPQ